MKRERNSDQSFSRNLGVLRALRGDSTFYGNAEETRQLMDELTGAHSYGGRVMSILDLLFHERPNLMLLEVAPEPSLVNYLADAAGIVPFNFNTDLDGQVLKGQFVCIADQIDECTALLNRAWSELPVEWGYDRD